MPSPRHAVGRHWFPQRSFARARVFVPATLLILLTFAPPLYSAQAAPWENYKYQILGIIALFVAETLLVVRLLMQIRRKNRTQQMVERRYAMEQVASEFSETLGRCQGEEIEEGIRRGLEEVCRTNDIAGAYWFLLTPEESGGAKVYSAARGTSEEQLHLSTLTTPWLLSQVKQGRDMAFSDVDRMPDAAENDRRYLKSKAVRSIVAVASMSEGPARGALILVSREAGQPWTPALVSRLEIMGNLFANAANRKHDHEALQEKQEWLAMALEASMTALWELDVKTGRVRWSQRQSSLLGREPMELEVSYDKFLELVPEEDREDLYQRAVALLADVNAKNEIVTEWRFHEPGGAVKWLLFRGRVFRDDKGRPLRLRGVNVDITDLKQAKMELVQLTERLIRAQEEERQRLAMELHDDIGQRLSLLIIGLDRLRQEMPAHMRMQKESINGALEEASELATDIHALSHQLHSSKLQHLGLASAIKELCSQVSRQYGIEVTLAADTIPGNVPEERALCLYRVAQEGLKNAAKHSGSTRVDVELVARENALQLRVRDHGCGFDLNHCEAGLGLASMRERLRMVGGTIQVQSAPGQGTEIVTEVALEAMAKQAAAN